MTPVDGDTAGAAEQPGVRATGYRFIAFISYRHLPEHEPVAEWLFKSIEAYRVPRSLRRAKSLGARPGRVFRDRDELPLSANLGDSINEALSRSKYLIAVCSPALRESKWCMEELRRFREIERRDIIPVVIGGDPGSGDPGVNPFPENVTRRLVERPDGAALWEEIEPIWADLRPQNGIVSKARRRKELLRVVAQLLEVGLDDLVERDLKARRNRAAAWVVGLVVVAIALGAAGNAARRSAERARVEGLGRLVTTLANKATTGDELDRELRVLLALEAFRLKRETGVGSPAAVDVGLRAALGPVVAIVDRPHFEVTLDPKRVLPLGEGAEIAGRFMAQSWAGGVTGVAFLPDGRSVLVGNAAMMLNSGPKVLSVWDYVDGTAPVDLRAPNAPARVNLFDTGKPGSAGAGRLLVTPGGRIALIVGGAVNVSYERWQGSWPRLWLDDKVRQSGSASRALALDASVKDPDFRIAYGGDDGTVTICASSDGVTRLGFVTGNAGDQVRSLVFGLGGVIAGRSDGSIVLVDVRDGAVKKICGGAGPIAGLAVAETPGLLAAACADGVRVWTVSGGEVSGEGKLFSARPGRLLVARDVAFSPDARDLAVAWGVPAATGEAMPETLDEQDLRLAGYVTLHRVRGDGTTEEAITLPGARAGALCVAFSPDGSRLAAGCVDLSAHVWTVPTERLVEIAERTVTRRLTREEREAHVGRGR